MVSAVTISKQWSRDKYITGGIKQTAVIRTVHNEILIYHNRVWSAKFASYDGGDILGS